MKERIVTILICILCIGCFFFIPSPTGGRLDILEQERDAYRDSLAIAKHEKQVLVMQLDTLQKIKIDEIRSVDSIHVDSLLLYIANFPTAKP